MKHKIQVIVKTEKKGLFGKKVVKEKRTIEVDDKTYRKMKKDRLYSLDEMIFYDEIFDE